MQQPDTPSDLVDEFKKSSEFTRLRRDLLAQFQQDKSYGVLKDQIEEIARKYMQDNGMLRYIPPDQVHKQIMQEVSKMAVLEQALIETPVLSSDEINKRIHDGVASIAQARKSARESAQGRAEATVIFSLTYLPPDGLNSTDLPTLAGAEIQTTPKTQDSAPSDSQKAQDPRDSEAAVIAEVITPSDSKAADSTQPSSKEPPIPMDVDAKSEGAPKQPDLATGADVEMADDTR